MRICGFLFCALTTSATAETLGPTLSSIMSAVEGADVAIIGEHHDNPHHHRIQADVARWFMPRAVVFEMLGVEDADALNVAWSAGPIDLNEIEDASGWAASNWPDFEIYAPIFQNMQALEPIPVVYGAEVDRSAMVRAMETSAEEVFGLGAARFGLDTPLPPEEQGAREALQLAAHCDALPVVMLPRFVEAQRLRDARLAEAVVMALGETGGPVLVITGNGHARVDWGMPAMLALAAPELGVVSVGLLEIGGEAAPFDLEIVTEGVERDDPCAAFAN